MNTAPPTQLHPILARRRSPDRFDVRHVLHRDELEVLVDAARWTPSAGNSQPWSFILDLRGDRTHARILGHLAASSARWAPAASAVIVNLNHKLVEDTTWAFSEFAQYDLGQAVAHMELQARAMGLDTRQFRAFDRAGVTGEFRVPPHFEVLTMTAVGRAHRRPAGDQPARVRRPLADLLWSVE